MTIRSRSQRSKGPVGCNRRPLGVKPRLDHQVAVSEVRHEGSPSRHSVRRSVVPSREMPTICPLFAQAWKVDTARALMLVSGAKRTVRLLPQSLTCLSTTCPLCPVPLYSTEVIENGKLGHAHAGARGRYAPGLRPGEGCGDGPRHCGRLRKVVCNLDHRRCSPTAYALLGLWLAALPATRYDRGKPVSGSTCSTRSGWRCERWLVRA